MTVKGGVSLRDVPYRRARGRVSSGSREFSSERLERPSRAPQVNTVDLVTETGSKRGRGRGYVPPTRKVDPYDFMKAEKLALDQERFLEKVLIYFAELITALLVSHLHIKAQVKWENIDYVSYDVYTHSLVDPSALNIFVIEDCDVKGIIFFEFPVCLAIVDRLLGGKGQPVSEDNRLTEIEEVIYCRVIQKILTHLTEAFKEIKQLDIKPDKMDCNPQAIQIYSPGDPMVIANFRTRIGDTPGDMKICLPLRFLKPLIPKLKITDLLPKSTGDLKEQKIAPSPFLIESARIGIVVELGKSDILFQDLVNIGVGDVVRLDSSIENPLKIKIESKVKFLGRPGVRDKKVAMQITKVVQEGDEEYEET